MPYRSFCCLCHARAHTLWCCVKSSVEMDGPFKNRHSLIHSSSLALENFLHHLNIYKEFPSVFEDEARTSCDVEYDTALFSSWSYFPPNHITLREKPNYPQGFMHGLLTITVCIYVHQEMGKKTTEQTTNNGTFNFLFIEMMCFSIFNTFLYTCSGLRQTWIHHFFHLPKTRSYYIYHASKYQDFFYFFRSTLILCSHFHWMFMFLLLTSVRLTNYQKLESQILGLQEFVCFTVVMKKGIF